ncbi:MAG: GH25 family lysozyme [Eubacterium sp.]
MKRVLSFLLAFIMAMSVTVTAFAESKFGIDVSYHNSNMDYVQEAKNGTRFVMIRIGYYDHIDEKFWENVKAVCNAGLDFGVYLYSYAYSLDEARIEADFVLDTLSEMPEEYKEHFVLPVAYDLEEAKMQQYGKTQITNQMVLFCDAVRDAGYTPMVYANRNWFTNYIDINIAFSKGYKLWYAYYPSSSPSFSTQIEIGSTGIAADMWQYTTTNGTLDKNIMYSSLSCAEHSYKNSTVLPTCTAKGYTKHTCENCSYYYKTNYTPVKAHTGKPITTRATTSADGKIVNTCTACRKTLSTTVIPKASSVKLSTTSYTYNGKVKTPTVTVKDSKGKTLVKNTDYTVSYATGRKNVGKYSVKITFKGKYSGTKTLYFTIKPKATSISSLTAGSKKFTVKWKKQSTQTTGYQIQYSTSSKFSNAKTVTVSKNSTTSKTISKLTAKKKYYVRVRTYKTVNGTKYYSSWSSAKSVTTKK